MHIQEHHMFMPQHFVVDCEMLLPIYPSLPVLLMLMILSIASTFQATELTRLRPTFSASFSISLASFAAFLLPPTELGYLVNGFGASSSSLSLQPNPVVGPIPPRRSLSYDVG
jgi:hypothetical protein